MRSYRLAEEFVDIELKRSVIAAIARSPSLYWELLDTLPAGAFAAEPATWERVARAIETETPSEFPGE